MRTGTTQLDVVARRQVAEDVAELTLRHPRGERLPEWTPGAHVALSLPNGMVRAYSLCGDRWDATTWTIAVRREAGGTGGSVLVHDHLHPGSTVGAGAPRSSFPLVPATCYTFVAGGIGITPFLPMLDAAARLGVPYRLLYVGRTRRAMPYVDELTTGRHGAHVKVRTTAGDGRPDLRTEIGAVGPGHRVYGCGPASLVADLVRLAACWPPATLWTEAFARPTTLDTDEPFTAHLARTGRRVDVPRTSSLLEALHAAGVDVMSSCRVGSCGACETGVVEGVVDHRDAILTDGDAGVMFPCVSRARAGLVVLDL